MRDPLSIGGGERGICRLFHCVPPELRCPVNISTVCGDEDVTALTVERIPCENALEPGELSHHRWDHRLARGGWLRRFLP